jgi:hypothetical protein
MTDRKIALESAITRRGFMERTALARAEILTGCAVNPGTGQQQLLLVIEAQEIDRDAKSSPLQFFGRLRCGVRQLESAAGSMIENPVSSPRHVVLVAPQVHWNTGNIGRTCLGAGAVLHLIQPLGFSLNERQVKRAGLDYWSAVSAEGMGGL